MTIEQLSDYIDTHVSEIGNYVIKYYRDSTDYFKTQLIPIFLQTIDNHFPYMNWDHKTDEYEVITVENADMTLQDFVRSEELNMFQAFLEIGGKFLYKTIRNCLESMLSVQFTDTEYDTLLEYCEYFGELVEWYCIQHDVDLPWLHPSSVICDWNMTEIKLLDFVTEMRTLYAND